MGVIWGGIFLFFLFRCGCLFYFVSPPPPPLKNKGGRREKQILKITTDA